MPLFKYHLIILSSQSALTFSHQLDDLSPLLDLLPLVPPDLINDMLLVLQVMQNVIEPVGRPLTILFEALDAEVFDRRTQAVKAGFDPNFFFGQCFVGVFWMDCISVKNPRT